jgi:hypothetical protein
MKLIRIDTVAKALGIESDDREAVLSEVRRLRDVRVDKAPSALDALRISKERCDSVAAKYMCLSVGMSAVATDKGAILGAEECAACIQRLIETWPPHPAAARRTDYPTSDELLDALRRVKKWADDYADHFPGDFEWQELDAILSDFDLRRDACTANPTSKETK